VELAQLVVGERLRVGAGAGGALGHDVVLPWIDEDGTPSLSRTAACA